MFVLVEMVDTVRIPPWNFHRQLNEAVAEELNKKLANKVMETILADLGSIFTTQNINCTNSSSRVLYKCILLFLSYTRGWQMQGKTRPLHWVDSVALLFSTIWFHLAL